MTFNGTTFVPDLLYIGRFKFWKLFSTITLTYIVFHKEVK